MTDEITNWLERRNNMPEKLREIANSQWNDWGESVREIRISIGQILDLSEDFTEFSHLYTEFMGGIKPKRNLIIEAEIYWQCYVKGMLRVKEEVQKRQL